MSEYECCFLISCCLEIRQLFKLIKDHWGIEVSHWFLDVILEEDKSTARNDNQVYNRALLRRLALNLLSHLQICFPELEGATLDKKVMCLNKFVFVATGLIVGFKVGHYMKMVKVLGEQKKAYLQIHNTVDL